MLNFSLLACRGFSPPRFCPPRLPWHQPHLLAKRRTAVVLVAAMSRLVCCALVVIRVCYLKSSDVSLLLQHRERIFHFISEFSWKNWKGFWGKSVLPNELETQSIFTALKLKSFSCILSSAPFFPLKDKGRVKMKMKKKKRGIPSFTKIAKCQPINEVSFWAFCWS